MSGALRKPSSAAAARVDAIEVFEQHGYTRSEGMRYLSDRSILREIPGGVVVVDGERKHKFGACPKMKAVTAEGAAFIAQQLKIAIEDRRAKNKKKAAAGKKKAVRAPKQPCSPEPLVDPCLAKILSDAGLDSTAAGIKMFDALAARAWKSKYRATKNSDTRTGLSAWTHFDKPFLWRFAMGEHDKN